LIKNKQVIFSCNKLSGWQQNIAIFKMLKYTLAKSLTVMYCTVKEEINLKGILSGSTTLRKGAKQ